MNKLQSSQVNNWLLSWWYNFVKVSTWEFHHFGACDILWPIITSCHDHHLNATILYQNWKICKDLVWYIWWEVTRNLQKGSLSMPLNRVVKTRTLTFLSSKVNPPHAWPLLPVKSWGSSLGKELKVRENIPFPAALSDLYLPLVTYSLSDCHFRISDDLALTMLIIQIIPILTTLTTMTTLTIVTSLSKIAYFTLLSPPLYPDLCEFQN